MRDPDPEKSFRIHNTAKTTFHETAGVNESKAEVRSSFEGNYYFMSAGKHKKELRYIVKISDPKNRYKAFHKETVPAVPRRLYFPALQ